jgi:hypothetical protein
MAEVRQTNESNVGIVTDVCCDLVRRSRTRCFRDPPPDSVLEEQHCTGQPDPSRNPRSRSGLLESRGRGRQRSRCNRTHPRMPGLEGGVHIAVIFVDQFELREQGPSSRLPRTLKVPPHQFITVPRRPSSSPPLLRDYPPRCWTTRFPVRWGTTKRSTNHHHSPISPRSSS